MKAPAFPEALTPEQQAMVSEAQLHTQLTGRPHPQAQAALLAIMPLEDWHRMVASWQREAAL